MPRRTIYQFIHSSIGFTKGGKVKICLADLFRSMIFAWIRNLFFIIQKSGIRRPVNFHILGYGFVPIYQKGIKGQYQLVVEESRWKQLKAKLKEATRKTTPKTFDERVLEIKQIHRGWINNFRLASIQNKLKEPDGWLRNRLRYCIWYHWNRAKGELTTAGSNKRERKRKNLIKLGVSQPDAFRWSRSRLGGWQLSVSDLTTEGSNSPKPYP
jgi:RNA-directed DNA polymerase